MHESGLMKFSREKKGPRKPTWTAQIAMLLLATLFLWLVGTGIMYLFRYVTSRLDSL
jgi:hypothetical protein